MSLNEGSFGYVEIAVVTGAVEPGRHSGGGGGRRRISTDRPRAGKAADESAEGGKWRRVGRRHLADHRRAAEAGGLRAGHEIHQRQVPQSVHGQQKSDGVVQRQL